MDIKAKVFPKDAALHFQRVWQKRDEARGEARATSAQPPPQQAPGQVPVSLTLDGRLVLGSSGLQRKNHGGGCSRRVKVKEVGEGCSW